MQRVKSCGKNTASQYNLIFDEGKKKMYEHCLPDTKGLIVDWEGENTNFWKMYLGMKRIP